MPKMGTQMRLYTPPQIAMLNVLDKLLNGMIHPY